MITRILTFAFIAGTVAVVATGCRKDKDDIAGKGGSATLRITPKHHGIPVDSCRIYIKYNAQDAPADGVYDDSTDAIVVGTGVPRMGLFPGLKRGNYYIFGRGWDPAISQVVRGGTPFNINNDQPQFEVTLPVGEE